MIVPSGSVEPALLKRQSNPVQSALACALGGWFVGAGMAYWNSPGAVQLTPSMFGPLIGMLVPVTGAEPFQLI